MKKTYLVIVLLTGLFACKKEEVKVYNGGDRVQFARTSNLPYVENLSYSFAGKGNKNVDTVFIPVDVTGRVGNTDREINLELIPGENTAVQGVDFDFGKKVIPAGSSKGLVEVILKKTPALETAEKVVALRVIASKDFMPGIEKQLKSRVIFYNFMIKPITWESRMATYFGSYSRKKHEFILYHLGFPEINFAPSVSAADPSKYIFAGTSFIMFQIQLRSLLKDLNAGVLTPAADDPFTYPLMDEFGKPVVFP